MLTRRVAVLVGLSTLLSAASLLLGRLLPGGGQIAYSAWVTDRMVTQIADTQRGVRYHFPSGYGSTTPVTWLTADQLLLILRRVEYGPQPGAAIFTPGRGLQAIGIPGNCYPDTVTGGGGRLACLERGGNHLIVTSVACALQDCDEQTRILASDDAIFAFTWSPNGAWLALVTIAIDGMQVEVVDGTTGEPIIAPHKVGVSHPQPQWSPDSQSLAYFSRLERRVELHVLDVQTRRERWSIPIGFIDRAQPFALAPGARSVMMVNYNPPDVQIIEVDLQDALARVLTDSVFAPQHQFLQWSPDGRQIALYGQRDDLGSGLMLLETGAPSVRVLVNTPLLGDHFIWRPCQRNTC